MSEPLHYNVTEEVLNNIRILLEEAVVPVIEFNCDYDKMLNHAYELRGEKCLAALNMIRGIMKGWPND